MVSIYWWNTTTINSSFICSGFSSRFVSWCSILIQTENSFFLLDFWTSGIYNPSLNEWQWLLANNNTRIDIDSSVLTQYQISSSSKKKIIEKNVKLFYINLAGQSLHYSFAQLSNGLLVSSSSSETYSSLCKISATRLALDNQTRAILLTSQQYGFQNQ